MPQEDTDKREQAQPIDPPCTACDADGLFRIGTFTDVCGDCYGSKLTGQAFEDWLAAENANREPQTYSLKPFDIEDHIPSEGDGS